MRTRFALKQFYFSIVRVLLVLICALALTACGVLEVGLEYPTPTPAADAQEPTPGTADAVPTQTAELATAEPPAATAEPPAAATAAPALPTATPTPMPTPAPQARSPLWVEYRDAKYGYGMALPCFWNVFPFVGAPSVSSYDTAFHRAHSVKGSWLNDEWPERALKFDTVIFEDIDPEISLADAVRQRLTSENTYVFAMEEVTIGANPAVMAEMRQTDDTSVSYLLPVFRLAPDKILFLSVSPRRAMASADMRRILESVSLSPDQAIAVPAEDPDGPVEGREIYFDEQNGTCFAYPSTFEQGEVLPGQPGLLGPPIKEGAGTIRAGLTIEVRDVPPESGLKELVDAYQEQILAQAGSVLQRSTDYRLYGEPAELVEYISGRDGARDLFAVYGNRLYHARFTPSLSAFPRAAADVEYLFEVMSGSFSFLPGDAPPAGPVRFFLVLPGDGGKSGPAAGCGDSAMAVESGRARTGSLASDVYLALEELFAAEAASYGDRGYTHPLSGAGLGLESVTVSGSGATVDVFLSGTLPPADACARAQIEAQIVHTVFQYPGVDSAMILLNGNNIRPLLDAGSSGGKTGVYRRAEIQ